MFLPLNRLFGLCRDVNKVFKGLPHEIDLRRNQDSNILHRTGTTDYKLEINHLTWVIPIVTPSLFTLSKNETYLASSFSNSLARESYNIYRSDRRDDKKSEIRITSTQHKPTHVYVVFQKSTNIFNKAMFSCIFHLHLAGVYWYY